MICAYEKVPVPSEEQTKGYEVEERRYIVVDPAELEKTEIEDGRMIEVHEFVKTDKIDPIFLERVYYLEPDIPLEGYNSLVGALKETGMAGICTWTMRRCNYFGALQINGKLLCLNTLRYADEVIPSKSLGLEEVSVSEKELKIAENLII